MIGRNRGIFIALSGIAIFVLALGVGAYFGALNLNQYGFQSAPTANGRQNAKMEQPSQLDRDRAGLPYFAERIASGSDPADGTEREMRELASQEAMAVWAFWMLVASVFGVATTLAGTVLIWRQIVLTRRAVEDTSIATKAMVRQNDLAEEALQRQMRAYVGVERMQFFQMSKGARPIFKATFTNFGQSFAHDLRTSIQIGPVILSEIDSAPAPDYPTLDYPVSSLAPSASIETSTVIEDKSNWDGVWDGFNAGRVGFLVKGAVTYIDEFAICRASTFKNYITKDMVDAAGNGTARACKSGNRST